MLSFFSRTLFPSLMWILFKSLRLQKKDLDLIIEDVYNQVTSQEYNNRPIIYAFWHGKMLTGWLLSKMINQKLGRKEGFAVVSLSKDGSFLANALEALGFRLIRGSSSRGKEELISEMNAALDTGHSVFITPDGPRGPREVYKYGSIRLASERKASIVFLKISHEKCWVFEKSWDKFEIPKPFSSVAISIKLLANLEFKGEEALRLYTESIQNELKGDR